MRFASTLIASVIALGAMVAGCGDSSEPTSTAAGQASSPTTTQGQSSASNVADALGATLTSTTAGKPGVVVLAVRPGTKSHLKPRDVIVAVNGKPVASVDELVRAIGSPQTGGQFTIRVVRGSHRFTLAEVSQPTSYIGANVKDGTGKLTGAVVVEVVANSPAAKAGLRRGDVITNADHTPVKSVDDLLNIIGTHPPGDTIRISVSRGSRQLQTTATLAHRPANRPAPAAGD